MEWVIGFFLLYLFAKIHDLLTINYSDKADEKKSVETKKQPADKKQNNAIEAKKLIKKRAEIDRDVEAFDHHKARLKLNAELAAFEAQLAAEPTINPADLKADPIKELNAEFARYEAQLLLEETIPSWIFGFWRWADEYKIEEYNIPRNKSDLLKLEHLSFESVSYFEREKFSTLPKEIGKLTNLKFLELGSLIHPEILLNELIELPKEIGNLTNLTHLYLQDNRLTELPKEIGNLSKLRQCKLGFNQLTTLPKEIGDLKELKLLTLWSNDLTELPKEIGLLKNLAGFDISRNPITTLPDEITNLTNLKKFYFDCKNLKFNELQHNWLSELKNNGCEFPSDFIFSARSISSPPSWIDEVPPSDEMPSWIGQLPLWEFNDESANIIKSFGNYSVTSVWHMTHIDNIESILNKGILSNTQAFKNIKPVDISDHSVQKRRGKTDPIYGRELHDYVPTYFNIKNPMLSAKRNIENKICLIEISLSILSETNFIFTDGNAASKDTNFYYLMNDLQRLPWNVLTAKYWNDFEDGKRERCAEVLVYPIIPPEYIKKIHCNSWEILKRMSDFSVHSTISEELFFNSHQNQN